MRTVSSTLATLAAAGSAVVLALSGPALAAAPTYTVKAGTVSTGTVKFTASSGAISFKTSRNLTLGCTNGTAEGTFKLSTKAKGPKTGAIAKTAFNGCRGPLNIALNVKQVGKWAVNITGDPVNGVTPGSITNVKATVSDSGGQCSFSVAGLVNGNFNQNTQTLNVVSPAAAPYPLTISNVAGCFGQVVNGDTAGFGASYTVSNPTGPITITKN